MFVEHPVFQKPSDQHAVVWRYLDFTKFVDLLDTTSLFFTRSDKFHDKFEGSYPSFNVNRRDEVYREIKQNVPAAVFQRMAETSKSFRRWVAVNCWHLNSHESAAMWRLYLKSDEGIAIQSTYSRLESSFLPSGEQIYAGVVKYIDYETEWMPEGNLFYPFVHKRQSFAHENELRCVLCRFPKGKVESDPLDFSQETISEGVSVPVDLSLLIAKIFVAPESPSWLRRLVESVARKYAIDAPIIQSALASEPVY